MKTSFAIFGQFFQRHRAILGKFFKYIRRLFIQAYRSPWIYIEEECMMVRLKMFVIESVRERAAAIAPWFHMHLPYGGPGLKSQAHHLRFFNLYSWNCNEKRTKLTKEPGIGPEFVYGRMLKSICKEVRWRVSWLCESERERVPWLWESVWVSVTEREREREREGEEGCGGESTSYLDKLFLKFPKSSFWWVWVY